MRADTSAAAAESEATDEGALEKHPILSAGLGRLMLAVLADRRLRPKAASFVGLVARRFFIDQFVYRAKIRRGDPSAPTVTNVEHPLDRGIPIRYETAPVYLGFVRLWVSALAYFRKRIGPAFDEDILSFLDGMGRCYADASAVYGTGLSTTRRPGRAPSAYLAFVYAVDPHLFCVPSLHVLVVGFTYKRLEEMLAARGLSGEYAAELAALRLRALRITESILYVRQHSVNCIPAALSMLGVIAPGFGPEESSALLRGLFADDPDIEPRARAEAIAYMESLYRELASVGPGRDERYEAISAFVRGYDSSVDAVPELA